MEDVSDLLLLGRNHQLYGQLCLREIDGVAAAISVGADPKSPSLWFKGDAGVPNEDALYVATHKQYVLMSVADSHFGARASHLLLERLQQRSRPLPCSSRDLQSTIRSLARAESEPDRSAATLLVAVFNRQTRRGFGLSYGDSCLLVLSPGEFPAEVNRKSTVYVSPDLPESLCEPERFDFRAPRGSLLLMFTDGIDECHYRSPKTSVRPKHLAWLAENVGTEVGPYAEALARMALAGVDGNPGGQDNIALIVCGV